MKRGKEMGEKEVDFQLNLGLSFWRDPPRWPTPLPLLDSSTSPSPLPHCTLSLPHSRSNIKAASRTSPPSQTLSPFPTKNLPKEAKFRYACHTIVFPMFLAFYPPKNLSHAWRFGGFAIQIRHLSFLQFQQLVHLSSELLPSISSSSMVTNLGKGLRVSLLGFSLWECTN